MPIGHSTPLLVALRIAAFAVDCIPLSSVVFTAVQISSMISEKQQYNDFIHRSTRYFQQQSIASIYLNLNIASMLTLYLYLEASFWVFFVMKRIRLQKPNVTSRMTGEQRVLFINRIVNELPSGIEFRKFMAGWFYWRNKREKQLGPSDFKYIHRDNVKDWMAWAFYSFSSLDDLENSPDGEELADELNELLSSIESLKGEYFPPGRNSRILPVILNHNTVHAYPKPLILYAVIYILESLAYLVLRVWGFDRYSPIDERYPSPHSKTYCTDPSLAYWKWEPNIVMSSLGDSQEDCTTPIVFIHGIGGGLFCYIYFIYELMRANARRAIFLIELPHVSMRLVEHVPHIDETVLEVEEMLHAHGYKHAYYIGHSLGSAVCAWLINSSKTVAGVALLDPITFLTYHPSLAYNFVYRHPGRNVSAKANEYLMHWLVSRELFISQYISRHFCWHRNVIWPDRLPEKHVVFISLEDQLIDGRTVFEYIRNHGVNCYPLDGDHAQFILQPRLLKSIVLKLTESFRAIHRTSRRKLKRH